MYLGWTPFYINFVNKGLSATQNISQICFNKKGPLHDEFHWLFASLFKTLITRKREDVSQTHIEEHCQYKGDRLSLRLKELEEACFITAFTPWNKKRDLYYTVIDEYTLFYLSWIAPKTSLSLSQGLDDPYWERVSNTPAWKAWFGYAFESICAKHITLAASHGEPKAEASSPR
jgi:uncharacterized protein